MYTLGIDEVGRGPLAGPVTLTLFARNPEILTDKKLLLLFPKNILRDSKKLSAEKRETISKELFLLHDEGLCFFFTASRDANAIDLRGISICIKECILELLEKAVKELKVSKNTVKLYLDGSLHADESFIHQETIIKGDEKIIEIACASIIAKVERDEFMKKEGAHYAKYGFEKHMGYGTEMHRKMIQEYGPCELHRKTYLRNCFTAETNS